ncbi:FMN-binding negative transcriptional regulator [Acinetobacter pseudolwoffii]|nr:FMN-binding negative transcriptional regulator [Acinetobacter pseudolwoffii]
MKTFILIVHYKNGKAMFVETEFREDRLEEITRIINEYPLASLIAQTQTGLIAEHIPLLLIDEKTLRGHISLENTLFKNSIVNNQVLYIFKAEDVYISPNYYPTKFEDHKKVPTWNYQVVHINGEIKFFQDQKTKLAVLGQLTKQHESITNGENAWKMSDAPKDYLMEMLNHLVAFEIKIEKIIAKSKLSQNREEKDFRNVITKLQESGKVNMAKTMGQLKR